MDPRMYRSAGPATIACEIFDQLSEFDTLVVPMGEPLSSAAAAKQLWPRVRIVGVQAEGAPSYFLSWRQGRAVGTDTCDTIADGLATRTPEPSNVDNNPRPSRA